MQVVVDQLPPNVLVSNCVTQTFDFLTCTEQELQDIRIPLSLQVAVPCTGQAPWLGCSAEWLAGVLGPPASVLLLALALQTGPALDPQCTALPPGSTSCLMAARRSAGCRPRLACPSRTGEFGWVWGAVQSGWGGSHAGNALKRTCWEATNLKCLPHPPLPPPQVPAALPHGAAGGGGAAGRHRERRAAAGGARAAELRRVRHAARAAAGARRPHAGACRGRMGALGGHERPAALIAHSTAPVPVHSSRRSPLASST